MKQFMVIVAGNSERCGWTLGDYHTLQAAFVDISHRIPEEPYFIWDNKNNHAVDLEKSG